MTSKEKYVSIRPPPIEGIIQYLCFRKMYSFTHESYEHTPMSHNIMTNVLKVNVLEEEINGQA